MKTGGSSPRVTFAVLVTAIGSFSFLQSLVIPVLSTIRVELHTSQQAVTWVLTAYLLSASVLTPVLGRLGDMFGKKRILVVTLAILTVGSLVAALAPDIATMIVARAVQGAGGGVLPLAFGLVRDEMPTERVSGAVASLASLTAAGAAVGIVAAGPIEHAFGYRFLFWIPMVTTAGAAVIAALLVPESKVRTLGRLSTASIALLAAWLMMLLLGISQAASWGWGNARTVALLGGSVAVAGAWAAAESRARTPLVDLALMRRRAVWTCNVVALLLGAGMYASFAFVPQFVQTPLSTGWGLGLDANRAGLMLLPMMVLLVLAGQSTGILARRFGGRATLIIGCFLGATAMLGLAIYHAAVWQVLLSSCVQGIGFGVAFAMMSAFIVAAVPAHQTGVASGMNANIRTVGGSVGAALTATVLAGHIGAHRLPTESSYTIGFCMLAAGLLVASVVGPLIPRIDTPAADTSDEENHAPHARLTLAGAIALVGDEID